MVPTAKQQSFDKFFGKILKIHISGRLLCSLPHISDHSQLQSLPWTVAKLTWAVSLNIWRWLAATAVVPDTGSASLIAYLNPDTPSVLAPVDQSSIPFQTILEHSSSPNS
jgi:hypothetical protein